MNCEGIFRASSRAVRKIHFPCFQHTAQPLIIFTEYKKAPIRIRFSRRVTMRYEGFRYDESISAEISLLSFSKEAHRRLQ